MSSYLNALVDNTKFYILPICNLKATNTGVIANPGYDWDSTGYIAGSGGTTNTTNWVNKNFQTTTISGHGYIQSINPDYISFSSSPTNYGTNPSNDDLEELVLNIRYSPNPLGQNSYSIIDYNGISKATVFNRYDVQVRIKNGKLYPIDILNFNSWFDVRVTTGTAGTSSIDRLNKVVPFNIVLWKKFISSDKNNFIQTTDKILLPVGQNSIPTGGGEEGI
jgi:hypothetical protein